MKIFNGQQHRHHHHMRQKENDETCCFCGFLSANTVTQNKDMHEQTEIRNKCRVKWPSKETSLMAGIRLQAGSPKLFAAPCCGLGLALNLAANNASPAIVTAVRSKAHTRSHRTSAICEMGKGRKKRWITSIGTLRPSFHGLA
jgi:hypothetical protein